MSIARAASSAVISLLSLQISPRALHGFTAGWPAEPLDGELWAGRGRFAAAQAAVAAGTPDDAQWRGLP